MLLRIIAQLFAFVKGFFIAALLNNRRVIYTIFICGLRPFTT